MKTVKSVLVMLISLAVVFTLFLAAYVVALSLEIPVDRDDLEFLDQTYENGVYTFRVPAKAGGLYCSGCSFRIDGNTLYVTVTGNVKQKSDDEERTFGYPCPGIENVKYNYKNEKTSLFNVPADASDGD